MQWVKGSLNISDMSVLDFYRDPRPRLLFKANACRMVNRWVQEERAVHTKGGGSTAVLIVAGRMGAAGMWSGVAGILGLGCHIAQSVLPLLLMH